MLLFIFIIYSAEIHFLLDSQEFPLKHLGDKQLWKGRVTVSPYSLYITSYNQQMMPLNFYCECYILSHMACPPGCQETFVISL